MKCNHLTQGESHVPTVRTKDKKNLYYNLRSIIGEESFAIFRIFNIIFLGWPFYLLIGSTGGPARGFTSHIFVPN
jgi:omega-6 fatty acid desaturase (delta-12 desaturase)